MNCIAFFLIGPSLLFNMPDSLLFMAIGQVIGGYAVANMIIPCLSEAIANAMERYPEHEQEVNDLSSGLYNSALGISYLIAPLYGSTV